MRYSLLVGLSVAVCSFLMTFCILHLAYTTDISKSEYAIYCFASFVINVALSWYFVQKPHVYTACRFCLISILSTFLYFLFAPYLYLVFSSSYLGIYKYFLAFLMCLIGSVTFALPYYALMFFSVFFSHLLISKIIQ